jgi:exosortase C (VPDSG-CTERM-specific)
MKAHLPVKRTESEVDEFSANAIGQPTEAPDPRRKIVAVTCAALLLIAFAPVLRDLTVHALGSDLHSHVVLIPFISAYLIYIQRARLPKRVAPTPALGMVAAVVGLISLAVALLTNTKVEPWSRNDHLAGMTFAFLCFVLAWLFFFVGRRWVASTMFPVAFLIFMVPLPDAAVSTLEMASMYASAEAADWFFSLSGTPFFREGLTFLLPNIALRVAEECSGIRSSWVLFITSLLASYLFLQSPWRRVFIVFLVIPLGILRNGFRILVIGLLCVHIGPEMIHSLIHRRGGPLFFVLSLAPLFALLWWLRARERKEEQPARMSAAADPPPHQ